MKRIRCGGVRAGEGQKLMHESKSVAISLLASYTFRTSMEWNALQTIAQYQINPQKNAIKSGT